MTRGDGAAPQTFRTVEAARGIAALVVVLFHASSSIFPAPQFWQARVFWRIFDFGYAGVFFFFVLSGFIIVHVHARDVGRPARLGRYLLKRAIRIYPLYWLVLAGIIAAGAVGIAKASPTSYFLPSVFLIGPEDKATVVAVAWTLYHEILFYGVFAAWLLNARLGAVVTAAWGLAIAAGLAMDLPVPHYIYAPVNLLFGFGVLTWRLSQVRLPLPGLIAVAGAAGFIAVGADAVWWQTLTEPVREQLYGLASAVGLMGAVALERRRAVAVPRALLLFGAASYSIYLVHFPLLSLFGKLSAYFGLVGRVPAEIAFVIVVALTVAIGIAVHKLVERPLLAAINTRAFARQD